MERPYFDMAASGRKMREIRKACKLSVKQVVEYMGFESTQAVYKWEAGKCFPQADNLIALAMLYKVNPLELLVEEDLVSSSCCLLGYPFVCVYESVRSHGMPYTLPRDLEKRRHLDCVHEWKPLIL